MYLLDTNIVIDFCNSKLPDEAKVLFMGIIPAISFITQIELFASSKLSAKEKTSLEAFVKMSIVYNMIDHLIIAKTINIRQIYKTKLPDAIIAATALVTDLILVTRNTSDFKNIEGLQIIDFHNL